MSDMYETYRLRRGIMVLVLLGVSAIIAVQQPGVRETWSTPERTSSSEPPKHRDTEAPAVIPSRAIDALGSLATKGRAPKTGYARSQFGNGWATVDGCDMRNIILARDFDDEVIGENCKVLRGTLDDPYTGTRISFVRGETSSDDVQIDHVVALSNAWQTGAQQLAATRRAELANDPLELVAVDGTANQAKADSDAATWLPPNKAFRCQYIARQIAVKQKYSLWVTPPERDAMANILSGCPDELLPVK